MRIKKVIFLVISAILLIIGLNITAQLGAVQPTASLTVDSNTPITENLIGLGYNSPYMRTVYTDDRLTEKMSQAIAESSQNGYFRMMFNIRGFAPEKTVRRPDSEYMKSVYRHLDILKENNITVHLSFLYRKNTVPDWLGGGQAILNDETRRLVASMMAEVFDHLINVKGYDNIKYWSPSNEMGATAANSSQQGFALFYYGPNVRGRNRADEYQTAYLALVNDINEELAERSLDGKLRMGSPEIGDYWPLRWARENFGDSPNVVFDTHQYLKLNTRWKSGPPNNPVETHPEITAQSYGDPELYERLLLHYSTFANLVKETGMPIIAGEFGPGKKPKENRAERYADLGSGQYGLMVAEQAIALLNAGFSGLAKWNITDLINDASYYDLYHGTLKLKDDLKPRSDYFSYGLLTKTINSGAAILTSQSNNPDIHTLAAQNQDGKKVVVAINRTSEQQNLEIIWPEINSNEATMFSYHPDDPRGSDYQLNPDRTISRQGSRNYVVTLRPQQMLVMTFP